MMSGAVGVRFFGKILGTERDYWVAEGTLSFKEQGSSDALVEERGKGCNTYVYWVTDQLLKDWIQLPDV